MQNNEQTRTFPGVLATLAAGFDLTAKHIWLLLLPALLDIFLWVGPRLRFEALIAQVLSLVPSEPSITQLVGQLVELGSRTNLFTALSVQVFGVPALMAGLAPEHAPLAAVVWDVPHWLAWLTLFGLLTCAGMFLTAIYYTLIATVIERQSDEKSAWQSTGIFRRMTVSWLRLIGLALAFLLLALLVYTPLLLLGSIVLLFNTLLGQIIVLIGPFLIIWLIVFLSMAPPGIILNNRPVRRAIVESLRLVQRTLPSTLTLLFAIIMLGLFLDWALLAVDNGGWLTAINIAGHAFVSTALAAALFIYYHDRYADNSEVTALT